MNRNTTCETQALLHIPPPLCFHCFHPPSSPEPRFLSLIFCPVTDNNIIWSSATGLKIFEKYISSEHRDLLKDKEWGLLCSPEELWQGWHKGGREGTHLSWWIHPPAARCRGRPRWWPRYAPPHCHCSWSSRRPRCRPARWEGRTPRWLPALPPGNPLSLRALGSAAAATSLRLLRKHRCLTSQPSKYRQPGYTSWLLSGGHLKKKCIEIRSLPVATNKPSFHHSLSVQQSNLVLGLQETEKMGVLLFKECAHFVLNSCSVKLTLSCFNRVTWARSHSQSASLYLLWNHCTVQSRIVQECRCIIKDHSENPCIIIRSFNHHPIPPFKHLQGVVPKVTCHANIWGKNLGRSTSKQHGPPIFNKCRRIKLWQPLKACAI